MSKSNLTKQEEAYLQGVGLSKRAITLYSHLLRHRQLTAKQAADLSGEFASAEYRLFRQLESLGLVRRSQGRPIIFTALPKEIGLRAAYVKAHHNLDQLSKTLGILTAGEHDLELIIGRQALYAKYAELAEEAERNIAIYAIGIAYSNELLRTQQSAIGRGVSIKHVIQEIKPSNFHVINKWQRLGVKLRYTPAERGFHLMIFDKQKVLITFSHPQNTDDRLSLLTENPAVVRLFETYFQDIWSRARKITIKG